MADAMLSGSMARNVSTVNILGNRSLPKMRAMSKDSALAALRRTKIKLVIERQFAGNQTDFARQIVRSPSQVGHWLKPIRNPNGDTCRDVEDKCNLPRDWLDSEDMRWPPQPRGAETQVAHGVSHPLPIMKPRLRSWEEAVETRERAPFALEIRDRALGDAHPVGNIGVFVPNGDPQSGDAVLILAADGLPHLRYYEAGIGGEWRGVSSVIGYPPVTGEILAVMATSMRRGLYEAM